MWYSLDSSGDLSRPELQVHALVMVYESTVKGYTHSSHPNLVPNSKKFQSPQARRTSVNPNAPQGLRFN